MVPAMANVDTTDLHAALGQPQTHVIDVRQLHEYVSGHVPGAAWIPMSTIPLRVAEIPTDKDVYVICQSGGRSMQVAIWLAANGIMVNNVIGGTGAWVASGLPVATGR